MYLAADGLILVDLYLTLKNPFYPREKRMLAYDIFLLLVFLTSCIISIYDILTAGTKLNLYDKTRQSLGLELFLF